MGSQIAALRPTLLHRSPISVISVETPAIKNVTLLPKACVWLYISNARGELPSEQTSIMVAKPRVTSNPRTEGPIYIMNISWVIMPVSTNALTNAAISIPIINHHITIFVRDHDPFSVPLVASHTLWRVNLNSSQRFLISWIIEKSVSTGRSSPFTHCLHSTMFFRSSAW